MSFNRWFIVGAGFLILMTSWGSQFAFSVFLIPLTKEFGWDRASTAGIFSLSILIFGVGSIFAGRMTDRLGPRLVVGLGGVFMAGGLLLSAATQNLWQLYICYGVMTGIGVSAGYGPLVVGVSRWFSASRGLAMGILSTGISVGIMLVPLLSSRLIPTFGWRSSFAILGLVTGAVIIGSTFFLRSDSQSLGQVPRDGEKRGTLKDTSTTNSPAAIHAGDWNLSEALMTRTFWMIFAGYLLWCIGFYMIAVHLAAYGTDIGLSPTAAAMAVSLVGVGGILGKFLMGLLSDRIGPQKVLVINVLLQGVCIFALMGSRNATSLYLFSTLFGFGYGGTGPQLPVVTAIFFGLASIGEIFGVLILSGQIGGAIGPLLAGKIFNVTQSYFLGFLTGGISVLTATLLMFLMRFPVPRSK